MGISRFDGLPEAFLHQVWDQRHYTRQPLQTLQGLPIQVIHPGRWNHDQGPDFLEAQIRIGSMEWFGHVELHLHSKDWYRHKHHTDPVYNGTMLHVVLQGGDKPIIRADGTSIPELILGPSIEAAFVERYRTHCQSPQALPCMSQLKALPQDAFTSWLPALIQERLAEKASRLEKSLKARVQDWEQVVWEAIMRYQGGPVNGEAFAQLAERIPISQLRRYHQERMPLEALLFGGAGLLKGKLPQGDYSDALLQRWDHLRIKHALPEWIPVPLYHHRMRPPAYPARRLSQMADWLSQQRSWVDLLTPDGLEQWLATPIQAHSYWQEHHRWGKAAGRPLKAQLSPNQRDLLLVNVLLPMAHLYHTAHGRKWDIGAYAPKLARRPAENNRIIRKYPLPFFQLRSLLEGQALLHLHKQYCQPRHCLKCKIGQQILAPIPLESTKKSPLQAIPTFVSKD